MNLLQIALLALIQGAAELLPISSSAHVILAERLMGLDPSAPELTFLLVMLHTGTMVAVLFYFWPRWKPRLLGASISPGIGQAPAPRWHFLTMVLLASVLTGILGLGLKLLIEKVVLVRLLGHEQGEVEHLFKNLPLIAAALFAIGLFILVAGLRPALIEASPLTPRVASLIGIVQALCLPFRGFSRSGATISTALCCGTPRALAEDFSFALAVVLTPPVIVLELHRLVKASTSSSKSALIDLLIPGLMGMAFSFLAGLLALRWLSSALEKGQWKYFGVYCIGASFVVLAAALYGL